MGQLRSFKSVCIVFAFSVAMAISSLAQTQTVLAAFNQANGANPQSTLIQAIDGNIYGTTDLGGTNNVGTVFKVTPSGTLTTLHNLTGRPSDGARPQAGVVQAIDGNFYGTTTMGGDHDAGFHRCPPIAELRLRL